MSTSLLKDLLLITNPKVIGLCTFLNKSALSFILPVFYIGIAFEFFNKMDFEGVAKRAFIAFFAISLLTNIHIEAVSTSLDVSSDLIKKYSPQNKFLTAYVTAKGEVSESKKGVWVKLTSIVKMLVEDPIVMIIFLLSYVSFFLLTQLYSLTYHLTMAMIGLCAVLSIFPMTSGSLKGAVKSMFWCTLMPFVVAIILCLIGDSDAFFKTYSGGIVQNLESLIQLLIMTIILLLSPMITSKLMSDSGISHVAESLGQMAGMATLIGGASMISKNIGGKALSVASQLHQNTSKPVMNSIKSNLSNKAQAIANNKGISHSAKSLTSNSKLENVREKLSDAKDNLRNTTFKEKIILGADSIVNKNENALAKDVMRGDARNNLLSGKISQQDRIPVGNYKNKASEYLRSREELLKTTKLESGFRNHLQKSQKLSNQPGEVKRGMAQKNISYQTRSPERNNLRNVSRSRITKGNEIQV